jgi:hypothetical protein
MIVKTNGTVKLFGISVCNMFSKQLVNARPSLINYVFAENQLTILELGR